MKSKPFVYDNKGNLIFVQKNQKFAKNMLDVQYQLSDVKKTARGNVDVSFSVDNNMSNKPQYTATNVQPSAIEAIKLTSGVKLYAKGGEISGPKPEFETLSKEEYAKKFKVPDPTTDNIEGESAIFKTKEDNVNVNTSKHTTNMFDDTKSQKSEKSVVSQLKDLKHAHSTSYIKDMSMNFGNMEDEVDHLESFEALDMSHRDPNWGKNIAYQPTHPLKKGRRPTSKEFNKSLGLRSKPKERHHIEKVYDRKRLPPAKYGKIYNNYSPGKMSKIEESYSKEISAIEKDSSFISEEIFDKKDK